MLCLHFPNTLILVFLCSCAVFWESKLRYDLALTHLHEIPSSKANREVWSHIFMRYLLIGQIMTLCDITITGDSDRSILCHSTMMILWVKASIFGVRYCNCWPGLNALKCKPPLSGSWILALPSRGLNILLCRVHPLVAEQGTRGCQCICNAVATGTTHGIYSTNAHAYCALMPLSVFLCHCAPTSTFQPVSDVTRCQTGISEHPCIT